MSYFDNFMTQTKTGQTLQNLQDSSSVERGEPKSSYEQFLKGMAYPEATPEELRDLTDGFLFVMADWCGHCKNERRLVNRFKDAQHRLGQDVLPRVMWALGTPQHERGQAELLASLGVNPNAFPAMYIRTGGKYVPVPDSLSTHMFQTAQNVDGVDGSKSFAPLVQYYLQQRAQAEKQSQSIFL